MILLELAIKHFPSFSIDASFEGDNLLVLSSLSEFILCNVKSETELIALNTFLTEILDKKMDFEFGELIITLFDSNNIFFENFHFSENVLLSINTTLNAWKSQFL